jgi:hypothetical protein
MLVIIISALISLNARCGSKKLETPPSMNSKMSVVVKYNFRKDGFKTSKYNIAERDSILKMWTLLNLRSEESQRGTRVLKMDAILEFSVLDETEVTQFYMVYLRSDHGTFVQKYNGKEVQGLIRSEYNNEIEKFLDIELKKRGIYVSPIDE